MVCVSHGGPGTGNVANEERGAQVRAISVFQPPSIGNRVHLHFLFSPPRHSLSHSLTHTHTHTHTRRKKEGGHHFGDGPRNKTPKQNPEREKNIYIYTRRNTDEQEGEQESDMRAEETEKRPLMALLVCLIVTCERWVG